ncbi:MAG: HigA family addiction module antidote protein [Treponema sp.]|jgi:addiction module HigA family antidote|nr:HigA family addiction module antidote protein [Treponema sp.]
MAKEQSPGAVFKSFVDQYNLTAAKVAEDIKLSQSSIRLLIGGKLKISVPIALRLSKYFATKPEYWIKLQNDYELAESVKNPKLASILRSVPRAKKLESKAKAAKKPASKAKASKKAAKKPAKKAAPKAKKAKK